MQKKYTLSILLIAILGITGCTQSVVEPAVSSAAAFQTLTLTPLSPLPEPFPIIDRRPLPADYQRGEMNELPAYDPESGEMWQVDLRAFDLSDLDLNNSIDDLMYADFDDQTAWPPADQMPADFDWQQIMEFGKNPGLGVRELHEKNITGHGIGIAVIDQPLLVGHQEYVQQLRMYEEADDIKGKNYVATMHGPTVTSIAVGQTTGVAPAADLYYIATTMCNTTNTHEGNDFACLAQSVYRVLEINKTLPEDRKIRVISISVGWGPKSKGYEEISGAIAEAKAAGMLVICSSVEEVHGFKFHALGRSPLADPDQFTSYEPGLFWAEQFYNGRDVSDRLLVPMDSRTAASPGGDDEYVFYRQGGWSWSIPYIAGLYALGAQVKPDITPDEFWQVAMDTGQMIEHTHDGKVYDFGPIVDPVALMSALQEK